MSGPSLALISFGILRLVRGTPAESLMLEEIGASSSSHDASESQDLPSPPHRNSLGLVLPSRPDSPFEFLGKQGVFALPIRMTLARRVDLRTFDLRSIVQLVVQRV